jgi:DNA replication protein DnaC
MSLQNLLLKASQYEISDYDLTKVELGRSEFISKFPLSKIQSLSLDEYCSGTDKNSFCYWLEYKNILFGIGGGNASKFGIYKGKDGKYYSGAGENKIHLKGVELSKQFNKILAGINEALELTNVGEVSKIKKIDIPIWNMVLQKILSIYYPDKFLLVGAVDVLTECAKDITIENVELNPNNLIEINYELKKKIGSLDRFKNWNYIKTGNFIWNTFHEETKRDYFILGSKYGPNNNEDISSDMINQSVVAVGFASKIDLTDYFNQKPTEIKNFLEKKGESQSSINALRVFLSLKAGDKIAIKASGSPRGKTPFLSIIAIAEVVERNGEIYSYHPEGLFHTVNVKYLNTGIYKEFELGGYGATIHKLNNPEHIKEIFETNYQKSSVNTEFDRLLAKMNPADVEVYFNFLKEIIQKFELKKGDKRIVFSLRDKRLVFTAGQRYCWILRNNNQSSFGVIYPKKINKDSHKFDGKEPRPYYCLINRDEFSNLEKSHILSTVEIELKRSTKSSYSKFNNSDFENHVFQEKSNTTYFNMQPMDMSLNTILYGPPGTGKTFALKNEYMKYFTASESAVTKEEYLSDIIQHCSWWQVIALALRQLRKSKVADIANHEYLIIKSRFSNSKTVTQTIWGQLLSHTIEESETVKVAKRQPPLIFNKSANSIWEILDDEILDQAPEIIDLEKKISDYSHTSNKEIRRYEFVTFHQSYSYEDFVEGIKPGLNDSDVSYKIEEGVFQKLCNRARNDKKNKYAIFIDEINRGNVSSIFGELITLIEEDKREDASNEVKATLPYSQIPFSVPENLYIIGTMNTADRSVEALDTALRRRFSFLELNPEPEHLSQTDYACQGVDLSKLLTAINLRIEKLLDKDYCIGHSYFMKINDRNNPVADLRFIFKNKILPLLQEYFYGDWGKIMLVLGDGFVTRTKSNVIFLSKEKYDNYEEFDEKPIYKFTESSSWSLDTFRSIYE